jgi:hypothetical protein
MLAWFLPTPALLDAVPSHLYLITSCAVVRKCLTLKESETISLAAASKLAKAGGEAGSGFGGGISNLFRLGKNIFLDSSCQEGGECAHFTNGLKT